MNQIKRNLAIVIGINEYTHPIPRLNTAANDAKALADILEKRYQYRVLSLLDREATHEKFNSLLNNLVENKSIELPDGQIRVQSDDRVLFYFAGHGFPRDAQESEDCKPAGFWIPQDGQLENSSTWLSMQALHDALTALECRHLLIILDCCFAGRFHWAGVTRNIGRSRRVYRQSYDRFVKHQAQQVITSAAHDEEALDALCRFGQRGEENGHSPFADLLLKVLDGKSDEATDSYLKAITEDGVVTAHELFTYLQNKLGQIAEQQTPCFFHLKKHDKGEYIFQPPNFNPEKLEELKLNKDTNPYKGLESFEKKDSNLFFGRKTLIQKLCEFVTENSLTVVLGLSGSGKSSLVKAGLIPALESVEGNEQNSQQQWQILKPIRPEDAPFSALNIALTEQNLPKVAKPGEALGQGTLAESLEVWRQRHPGSKLLLVIDQSEELITLRRDDREREDFLRSLTEALASEKLSDQLRLVLTLRSDFEPQIRDAIEHTHWQKAWQGGRFVVMQMNRQELQEAIEEPAAARALFFESPKLINQLIDEVIQMPGALPLLSFTLSELYLMYLKAEEKEERSERTITEADYKTLGGVTLSLTKRADQEYKALVDEDPAYERTIRNITLRMVAMSRGELARRQVPLSELEYPEPEENNRIAEVRRRFLEARLTVEGLDASGNQYVEPAHDALVRGWPKLGDWITEQKTLTLLQQRLTSAANDWFYNDNDNIKEKKGFLWADDPRLPLLEKVLDQPNDNWLNRVETEFVKQSIQHRNQKLERAKQQLYEAIQGEASALGALSEARFQDDQLGALVYSLKAGKKLQQIKESPWIKEDVFVQTEVVLQQTLRRVQEYNRLEIHHSGVSAIDFISDGQMIATEDREGIIRIWQLDGALYQTLEDRRYHLSEWAVSPDGKMFASQTQEKGTIHLWNDDDTLHQTLKVHGNQVMKVIFSPDNQIFATASWEHEVKLWKRDGTLYKTLEGHQGAVTTLDFSSDGEMIASASTDKTVRLWKSDGTLVRTFDGHRDAVWSVCISPDGKMLASGGQDTTVKLWKSDGALVKTLTGHKSAVRAVRFSPDGQILASGSDDGTVKLWNLGGTSLKILDGHIDVVYAVCFSPDGKTIATTHGHGQVSLWNSDGTLIKTEKWQGGPITAADFSPNGEMIATASGDRSVHLSSSDGACLIKLEGHTGESEHKEVLGLSFSPDSQMVATGSVDGSVRLWTIDGKLHTTLQEHGSIVRGVCFSPDGEMIASGGDDRTVKLWKQDGTLLLTLTGHEHAVCAVCFSPDGETIASASADRTVKLWKRDGTLHNTLTGHTHVVRAVCFSSDSTFIATGSYDNTVKLWKRDGTLYKTLHGHSGSVHSVTFSPDGKTIASASSDKTVILWKLDLALDLDELLAYGCNWVRDYLNNNPNGQKERSLLLNPHSA